MEGDGKKTERDVETELGREDDPDTNGRGSAERAEPRLPLVAGGQENRYPDDQRTRETEYNARQHGELSGDDVHQGGGEDLPHDGGGEGPHEAEKRNQTEQLQLIYHDGLQICAPNSCSYFSY